MLGAAFLVFIATGYPSMESEFQRVVEAPAEGYLSARDAFLKTSGASAFLKKHAAEAPSAESRAIAAALLTRLERPEAAIILDGWAPSEHTMRFHNPFPRARAEMREAYKDYPHLAYERVTRFPGRYGEEALLPLIAEGPEAIERLESLLTSFYRAPSLLTSKSPKTAAQPLLKALASLPPPPKREKRPAALIRTALLGSLGQTTSHRKDVLARLHSAFRDPALEEHRETVVRALAELGDKTLLDEQLNAMANPSLTTAVWEVAGTLLGPKERQRQLAQRTRHADPQIRLAAASALSLGRKTFAKEHASLLATLLRDESEKVRAQAANSLRTLAISARGVRFSKELERATVVAASDATKEVRVAALGALWRLVVEQNRPLSPAMQNAVAAALESTEKRVFNSATHNLTDFFGEEAGVILLMLHDIERIEDRWPYAHSLAEARKRFVRATAANVDPLCRKFSGLNALCDTWRARPR